MSIDAIRISSITLKGVRPGSLGDPPIHRSRILVFCEEEACAEPLVSDLVGSGFEVSLFRTFLEATSSLALRRFDLFVFFLPEEAWMRQALLAQARCANPNLPIVAVIRRASDDIFRLLARFHVASALPARGNRKNTLEEIRKQVALRPPPSQRQWSADRPE